MFWYVSDTSAFSDVQKHLDGGFRMFNQFAVFVYSQLQNILPDSVLGNISDWDTFLSLDLDSASLPFKTAANFILNEDFHRLVYSSKLPRPSKFIDQSLCFCKTYCKQLLDHDIVKSDLLRGLSAFDSSVILESPEIVYVAAIDKLSSHFVSIGLFSSGDKVKQMSEYRSFVTKLRLSPLPSYDNWVHYLLNHYEVQCRPHLLQLFQHLCYASV